MKIKTAIAAAVISAAIIAAAAAAGGARAESETEKCVSFLSGYGIEVKREPIEEADITIPAKFDAVYKSYNRIQLEAGLDLTPHRGKRGRRYTFLVTNYPIDPGEPVRANVICVDGEPAAGDVMTVSVNGFMHSLAGADKSRDLR